MSRVLGTILALLVAVVICEWVRRTARRQDERGYHIIRCDFDADWSVLDMYPPTLRGACEFQDDEQAARSKVRGAR